MIKIIVKNGNLLVVPKVKHAQAVQFVVMGAFVVVHLASMCRQEVQYVSARRAPHCKPLIVSSIPDLANYVCRMAPNVWVAQNVRMGFANVPKVIVI